MSDSQPPFLIYLRQLFEHFGPKDEGVLNELNNFLFDLTQGPTAFQHEPWRRSIEIIADFPRAPDLAFQLGFQIPITAFLPMAIPIRFAPTIRKMLWFCGRYYHLQAPLISLTFRETDNHGAIDLDFRLPVSEQAEAFSLAAAASLLNFELSHITGHKQNIQQVHLRQGAGSYAEHYKQLLGKNPKTNQAKNCLLFSREIMEQKNSLADAVTFENYIETYEAELTNSFREKSVTLLVSDLIYSHISDPPSLGEAARLLNQSERQLRFALTKEETSYREILQTCRTEFAIQHLKNPRTPISQIAYKLGYNDLAAFNHGFKRWTGKNPSDFQKSLKSTR